MRCEYFLTPEEVIATVNNMRAKGIEPSEDGKRRLVEWYKEKKRVPKYVHAAVKALEKVYREEVGETIDAEMRRKSLPHVAPKITHNAR